MADGAKPGAPGGVQVTYDDQAARRFLWATLIWGVVGMLVGVIVALQLAFWPANTGLPWLSFGRLRPLHTNAVIFAFAGNAFFAGLYYSLQRLLKTRMWSDVLTAIHFWGWQLIIVSAAVTLPLGITRGKEYAELEWPIGLMITLVWVAMTVNVFGTIIVRRVKHLYVSIWFYLGSILTVAVLHVVNGLVLPVTFLKSYPVYAGVQDALVQWWYGHNAVGFLLTTPFLGMMYYFLPKAVGRPVYSYRLSIVHFWTLVFIYIWAGPHHLLYTSLPEWAQSLGMVFSLMLIAPSWGGMINGLLTMRGAWHKVRTDPVLKFFVLSLTFYGMVTLEGPLLSIKSLNLVTHYTDWIVAHVHAGALGWVGGMIFAVTYYLAPKLWGVPLYSQRLANQHFWIATVGILLYVVAMWTAGLTQGLMWFATDADGSLRYPQFVETVIALQPLYWTRLVGGLLYLVGALLCLYNVWRTAQSATKVSDTIVTVHPERHIEPRTFHERLENNVGLLAIGATIMVLIGGIIELVPTFLIEANVPSIASVKPYTPLELEGRDIYVREGCYTCHSQMVRTHPIETKRYGLKSEGGEFVYDHPFQWGSKRIGPDLHRVGGKYPDLWHYRHMLDPRTTSPGSIMPSYAWMASRDFDASGLKAKIAAMRRLGVPYSDQTAATPEVEALAQSRQLKERLAQDGVTVSESSELLALIAYLQRLGTDIKKSATTAAGSPAGGAL